MSLRASAGDSRSSSGAMYASVPEIVPASVSVPESVPAPTVVTRFAIPKSSTFARPSGVTTTLALLRSR